MPRTDAPEPTVPPSFHVDQVEEAPIGVLVELLDRQAELPGVRRMRRWAHEALAVTMGERALDIGSGTGSEVLEFAERVGPDGDAVGVDPNPAMLAVARERAAAADSPARFLEGTAYRLPFPDHSFDAVRCERVYQHLDDPAAATAEIARVLRPGGRVLLIDSDWFTAITHPGEPAIVEALGAAMLANTPNPGSGRRLRGLLAAAGFVIDDQGSEAVIWTPDSARGLFTNMSEQAVAAGVITAAECERFIAELEAGFATGDYHLSVTMFAVLAHLA
ncbi:methyltransferase domain-containing protein [Nocardia sp. NPDC050710]|uniref:methyltransferase domain-containing protein n=1 Tax=Nocardia sp. NPDC050710 TaxID=3157220 RepID=UPI0033F0AB24